MTKAELERLRESVLRQDELRIHLQWSRSGLTCKARLWQLDGVAVGSASGGGYDKGGAALGEAISKLFAPQLAELPDAKMHYVRTFKDVTSHDVEGKQGVYGMWRVTHPGEAPITILDGACGLDCMLRVLKALGYSEARRISTSSSSDLILATKRAT